MPPSSNDLFDVNVLSASDFHILIDLLLHGEFNLARVEERTIAKLLLPYMPEPVRLSFQKSIEFMESGQLSQNITVFIVRWFSHVNIKFYIANEFFTRRFHSDTVEEAMRAAMRLDQYD